MMKRNIKPPNKIKKSISLFITKTAFYASRDLNAKAIFTPTESGFTARNISRFRPNCPIYALVRNIKVQKQLQLSRGVIPILENTETYFNHDKMIDEVALKLYDEKSYRLSVE